MKSVWNTLLRIAREHTPLVKLLLKYGLGIGLLAYVIFDNWAGLKDVFKRPIHIEPLLLATGIASVGLIITFLRWHLLVRAVGLPFSRYNAIRLGLVGYYFNTFLPGSIGGDIVKAYAIAKEQSRRTVAVATVLIDRIIGLWALIWFVAIIGSVFWMLDDALLSNEILKGIIVSTIIFCAASLAIWFIIGFMSNQCATAIADQLEHTPRIGWLSTIWCISWRFRFVFLLLSIALLYWTGQAFWAERELIWNTSKLRTRYIVAFICELAAVAVFLGIGFVPRDKFNSINESLVGNRKIGGSLAEFWRACWMYRQKSRAVLIAMLMSMVGHTGWVLVFHYCVTAIEWPDPQKDVGSFFEHMIVVPVGMTVQAAIPVPGGIGVGEAAYGKLYEFIGKKEENGVAGCMLQRVIFWGLAFLGYLVYTRMRRGIVPKEAEAEVAKAQPPPDVQNPVADAAT